MRILMMGDIVGRPGRTIVERLLPEIRDEYAPDVVIANAENAAGGFGITRRIADDLFQIGIDVLTSGNHIWDQKEIMDYLDHEPRLLRPANYPPGAPGHSVYRFDVDGRELAVISLSGRVYIGDLDGPFRSFDQIVKSLSKDSIVVVDFHAEATSEKVAFGWYADGRASIVVGTHTHVPTADQRILPGGTAYATDLGMCGPLNGVLGIEKETVINKFITQLPARFSVAQGPSQLCGVIVDIGENRKAQKIARIYYEKKIM